MDGNMITTTMRMTLDDLVCIFIRDALCHTSLLSRITGRDNELDLPICFRFGQFISRSRFIASLCRIDSRPIVQTSISFPVPQNRLSSCASTHTPP